MQSVARRAERACEVFVRCYVGGAMLVAAGVALVTPAALVYLLLS